jgi:hypothetical protein
VLAVAYGLFGQDFGGLLTGQATDPGTAPLLVLLALALWPRRARPAPKLPARAAGASIPQPTAAGAPAPAFPR